MADRVGVALVLRPPEEQDLTAEDRRYGSAFHQASLQLGAEIAGGRLPTVRNLWARCREWRLGQFDQMIAGLTEVLQRDAWEAAKASTERMCFATGREEAPALTPGITPIGPLYESIVPKAMSAGAVRAANPADGLPSLRLSQTMGLHGCEIELTALYVYLDLQGTNLENRLLHMRPWPPVAGYMQHTRSDAVAPLMDHVDTLYQRVQSPGLTPEARLDLLAEMHWVLAHAMPDHRGSAAKSELAVRATALAVGLDLPPFRPDVGPDLEAFVTPLEQFVERYRGPYFMNHDAG